MSVTLTSARAILHHTDHTLGKHFAPECMHCSSHFEGHKWNRVIDFFGDVLTLILTYSSVGLQKLGIMIENKVSQNSMQSYQNMTFLKKMETTNVDCITAHRAQIAVAYHGLLNTGKFFMDGRNVCEFV